MSIDQHPLFEEFVDVTDVLPSWLPALDIDPDWHIDHGGFPHCKDKALIEKEEPDVQR